MLVKCTVEQRLHQCHSIELILFDGVKVEISPSSLTLFPGKPLQVIV